MSFQMPSPEKYREPINNFSSAGDQKPSNIKNMK